MKFEQMSLPGVVRIKPTVYADARGYFMESWHADRFAEAGIDARFVQENFSHSSYNTLRGIHYQVRQPQGKLVRVTQGEVFDVAVDLRQSSPQFGKWVGAILSAENKHQLWVPPEFGHAFLVMSEVADFAYKCTDYYAPQFERCIRWNDPDIAIDWPLVKFEQPITSEKDAEAPSLKGADLYS